MTELYRVGIAPARPLASKEFDMDQIIQLAQNMNWPFAMAVIGLGFAVAVPTIVSIAARSGRSSAAIQSERDIAIRKIDVSVKNGAVPARVE